jgi:hypothetical protein
VLLRKLIIGVKKCAISICYMNVNTSVPSGNGTNRPAFCFLQTMRKRNYLSALLFILFGSIALTGCIVEDNRYDPPPPPSGYQYIFDEDFNNDIRGWEFEKPNDSAYGYLDNIGIFNFIDYSANWGTYSAVVPVGLNPDNDFLAQSRFRSDNAMAMVFGASNHDYGYTFFVDNEQGLFAVYYEGDDDPTNPKPFQTLLNWQASSAIQSGYNKVEIEQVGNYWYGYINDSKVFEIPARYLAGDQFGFMVLPGTTGKADYLTVKY